MRPIPSSFSNFSFKNVHSGPKFELIATASLKLIDASDLPHTHDLTLCNVLTNNSQNQSAQNTRLPLFGHFCCRLAVQPDFITTNYYSNELQLLTKEKITLLNGFGRLQAFKIDLFKNNAQIDDVDAVAEQIIDITRDTKLKRKTDVEFIVCNLEEGAMHEYLFRAKNSSESSEWQAAIKRAIREHIQWDHIVLRSPMKLTVPGNATSKYFNRSPRQGSLYDQVPVVGKYLI